MTKAEQFEALALRCEQATGPDRELDLVIYLECNPDSDISRWVRNYPRGLDGKPGYAWDLWGANLLFEARNAHGDCYHNGGLPLPQYTGSLDAALTLVPAKSMWSACDMEEGPFAQVIRPMPDGSYVGGHTGSHGRAPSLALCAAALRARAQLERGK